MTFFSEFNFVTISSINSLWFEVDKGERLVKMLDKRYKQKLLFNIRHGLL